MPVASMHKALAEQLGPDWRDKFAEFDDSPAAAASIGQVHRAVWKLPPSRKGAKPKTLDVAVKVQYPGAGEALLADLKQLGRLAGMFKIIQPGMDMKPLLAELRARITEELDYAMEAEAQQAFAARDYRRALSLASGVVEKFKGMPAEWAQLATSMLGDIYVAMNDLAKAEAAYKEYQRLYPGAGSLQADVGIARIAVSKKDLATAKQKLEPIAAQALKDKNVSRTHALAYSQAFFILGQVKEAEGNRVGALEDYLRTVTIFHHDPSAVTAAQERADALRKDRTVVVP